MGFVFQFHHLLPEFSAIENVCYPAMDKGYSRKPEAIAKQAEEDTGSSRAERQDCTINHQNYRVGNNNV